MRIAELDRIVQSVVMGWDEYKPNFMPSLHVEHAMQVEQRLYELGYDTLIRRCIGNRCGLIARGEAEEGEFFCNVSIKESDAEFDRPTYFKSVESTMPLAICRSAIQAMGARLTL